jgi:arylsulfatase A-like enzyme
VKSLVLITVDCLRADHVGFLGYDRPTTPFLDCVASEGISFQNAVVAGAPTYYSLPAILASRPPLALGRDLIGIAPGEATLATVLRDSGFATAAFTAANPYISKRFGYDSGFDSFNDFFAASSSPSEPLTFTSTYSSGVKNRLNQALARACHSIKPLGSLYDDWYFEYCQKRIATEQQSLDALRRFPSADVITENAISWLQEHSKRPFFLWLHFMDPHGPYFPKAEALASMGDGQITGSEAAYINSYWNRGELPPARLERIRDKVIKLYDAGIRWADEQMRRLTETLVELNVWDKCALAVTADHGEEFLEHRGTFHAPLKLTEELVHVPLLLRVPGSKASKVAEPFGLIDLSPTLLDVLDVPAPAEFRGQSWWGALKRNRVRSRPVITECVLGCTNPFLSGNRLGDRLLAVRSEGHKLVIDFASGSELLFDLNSDPSEHNPLPTSSPRRRELLAAAKRHLVESTKARDFDRREASLLRDHRLEWAHSAANFSN